MTDHPFISTSYRSDTLKMMLCMGTLINWCDFSSAETNNALTYSHKHIPAYICLMLYVVKYIEVIIKVEENVNFLTSSSSNVHHLTYKINKHWFISINETLKMTEPAKVVPRCPPLYTSPSDHMVSRQSQASFWSRSFMVPWAKLYVFSLKARPQINSSIITFPLQISRLCFIPF